MTPGTNGRFNAYDFFMTVSFKPGRDGELRAAGIDGLQQLFRVQNRAGAHQHLRELFANVADGWLGGGRAEGDLHDVEAAGEERFGKRDSVFRVVNDHDGHDSYFCNTFHGYSVFWP